MIVIRRFLKSSWFVRSVGVISIVFIIILSQIGLKFLPYFIEAVDKYRLDNLNVWYLPAIEITPLIVVIGSIGLFVIICANLIQTIWNGRLEPDKNITPKETK